MKHVQSFSLWLFTLFLVSCASQTPELNLVQLPTLPSSESPVFPNGHYRHHVELHILSGENGKAADFAFEGIAEISAQNFKLVILSPLHTTLMKITEDRIKSKVSFTVYDDHLRRYQNQFADYYAIMRKVFVLPSGPHLNDQLKSLIPSENGSEEATVTLSHFVRKIPRLAEIKKNSFNLKIAVEPLDETLP